ncbi:MAG: MFS transporter [Planctomycetota bacterium]
MSERSRSRNVAVVAGCLVAMFVTAPGQTFVVSTFNDALTTALDVSPTRLAGAYLVGTLLSAACLPWIGRVADRIGPRRMMMAASVGLALAGVALSAVQGIVALTLAFFLLRVFGQGALSLSSSHALALRYDANLGAVEGLRGATISAAIAVVPQVSIALIAARGWRGAAVVLAVSAGAVGLLAALFLVDRDPPRRAPTERDRGGDDGSFTLAEARATASLWILFVALATVAAVLTAVHFHLQPILATAGMNEAEAARTFASFAAAGLAATLVGGLLADRMRPSVLLTVAMTLLAVGTVLLGLADSALDAHVGMALHGVAHGIATATMAPTIARYFGRAHHGAIRGLSGSVGVAGSAAGPWALSALADVVGGFGRALLLLGLATVLVAAWCAFLRRPVRRPDPHGRVSR